MTSGFARKVNRFPLGAGHFLIVQQFRVPIAPTSAWHTLAHGLQSVAGQAVRVDRLLDGVGV
jgi:hypothetical protein